MAGVRLQIAANACYWRIVVDHRHKPTPPLRSRTTMAKAFTPLERGLKVLSGLFTFPLLIGSFSVKQNWTRVIQRFGKIDRVCEPGLRWAPLGYDARDVFMGARTQRFANLNVVEKNGSPIVVSAVFNYHVSNPAKFTVAVGNDNVLFNLVESAVRNGCREHPLNSDAEPDIRRHSGSIEGSIASGLAASMEPFGVTVDSVRLVEANYASEVAQQMLMKQQAQAVIAARKELVTGALGIVEDVLEKLPTMRQNARDKLASNLLVTLTAGSGGGSSGGGGGGHVQVVQTLQ